MEKDEVKGRMKDVGGASSVKPVNEHVIRGAKLAVAHGKRKASYRTQRVK